MSSHCTGLPLPPFPQSLNVSKPTPPFHNLPFTTIALQSSPFLGGILRKSRLRASEVEVVLDCDGDDKKRGGKSSLGDDDDDEDAFEMNQDERRELRKKIRQIVEMNPEVVEEVDPEEKRRKMQKLLADYSLVVEEEDPDWPEDADGWGFNFGQFFDKITVKNVKKEDEDDDNENEVNWQDVRAIEDITGAEWEATVFKDISPLVILVHNRYKRPKQNEMVGDELEKAVRIIWDCGLPSPRCVAIDAVVECDLVSALGVSVFPQLIFTKAGKILHREKETPTADELSKIMAFFYFGAAKPPCLDATVRDEPIPGFAPNK